MAVRSALTMPPVPPDVKVDVFGEQATVDTMKGPAAAPISL